MNNFPTIFERLQTNVRPILAGILNVTPDSFSDGGDFPIKEAAIKQARALSSQGAHIIDIGAESSGPGSSPISAQEEQCRLLNLIADISKSSFISIDTYRASTAKACLLQGASMINDISALRADNNMAEVIAENSAFVVLMYSKEDGKRPHVSTREKSYRNIVDEIIEFLEQRITHAKSAGIKDNQIILDPGMGAFLSHDPNYSWQLLQNLNQICTHFSKYPVMVGTSRKGFLGGKISDRDIGSQITALAAVEQGAAIVRTHNISMASEVFNTYTALNRKYGTIS